MFPMTQHPEFQLILKNQVLDYMINVDRKFIFFELINLCEVFFSSFFFCFLFQY